MSHSSLGVEHSLSKRKVVGSNPACGFLFSQQNDCVVPGWRNRLLPIGSEFESHFGSFFVNSLKIPKKRKASKKRAVTGEVSPGGSLYTDSPVVPVSGQASHASLLQGGLSRSSRRS